MRGRERERKCVRACTPHFFIFFLALPSFHFIVCVRVFVLPSSPIRNMRCRQQNTETGTKTEETKQEKTNRTRNKSTSLSFCVCVSVCAFAFVHCVKKTWDAVKVLQITRAGAQRSATMKSSVKIRLPDCETWMNKCVRTKVCILFVHIHTERDIHSQKLSTFTSICIRTWTFRNNPFFFPILWCFVLIVIWKFHNLQIFKQMTMNSASGHTKCDFVRRLLLLSLHCHYHYYYCCCCSHRLYWDRERAALYCNLLKLHFQPISLFCSSCFMLRLYLKLGWTPFSPSRMDCTRFYLL